MRQRRGAAAVAVAACLTATIAGCSTSAKETATADPTPRNATVCVAASASASRPLAESYLEALKEHAKSGATVEQLVTAETPQEAVKHAVAKGCGVIATLAPSMAAAAREAAAANPDIVFEVAGFQPSKRLPKNLVPLNPGFDEAAFLAGYAAAATTRSGILGVMTASTGDSAVAQGFAQGVDFYNQAKGTGIVVQGWNAASRKATAVTSEAEVTSHVGTYLAQGADIVLVAAEAYSPAAIAAVKEAESDASLIFVGSDAWETIPDSHEVVMTSLLSDPTPVAATMLTYATDNALHDHADIGFTQRIEGAHLADFRDYGVRLSDEVKEELERLRDQIDKREIPIGKERK